MQERKYVPTATDRETRATPGITFVLTSCGRFDLLHETIKTFLEFNAAPIARYILVEDSGDEGVRGVLARFPVAFDVLVNQPPCGQMQSIDRAYARVTTPYIFHCEDDWRFFRTGFVEESMRLLERDARISAVICRRTGQNSDHDRIVAATGSTWIDGVECRVPPADAHAVWGGYSFNPGLRRRADYLRLGAFSVYGSEAGASHWFKRAGMGIAMLEQPACETTGRGRHLEDAVVAAASRPTPAGQALPNAWGGLARNAPCPCGSGRRYKRCHGQPAAGTE